MNFKNFSEAKQYLYIHTKNKKYNLFKISKLLEKMGNFQENIPVVHVVGTNGKGSISSTLAAALNLNGGYNVGLFTSPHLSNIRERIVFNGRWISEEEFIESVEEVSVAAQKVYDEIGEYPTFFELIYATALVFFKNKKVDVAVLEAGLGGRLDATNTSQPILTIITRIGLDHRKTLGGSLLRITREKAAVIRENHPVVVSLQRKKVRDYLKEHASSLNSPFYYVPDLVGGELKGIIEESGKVYQNVTFSLWPRELVRMNLLGQHQVYNASSVLVALQVLKEKLGYQKIDLSSPPSFLERVFWPGRLEIHEKNELKDEYAYLGRVILDGAHNIEGMGMLATSLELMNLEQLPVILGILGDKNIPQMAKIITSFASPLILTTPPSPRALSAKDFARKISLWKVPDYYHDDLIKALKFLRNRINTNVLICGSLYLVGEYRKIILKEISEFLWK